MISPSADFYPPGFAVRIKTRNDVNGNPRRAWIIWNRERTRAAVYPENYHGLHAVPESMRDICRSCPEFTVSVKEFQQKVDGIGLL